MSSLSITWCNTNISGFPITQLIEQQTYDTTNMLVFMNTLEAKLMELKDDITYRSFWLLYMKQGYNCHIRRSNGDAIITLTFPPVEQKICAWGYDLAEALNDLMKNIVSIMSKEMPKY